MPSSSASMKQPGTPTSAIFPPHSSRSMPASRRPTTSKGEPPLSRSANPLFAGGDAHRDRRRRSSSQRVRNDQRGGVGGSEDAQRYLVGRRMARLLARDQGEVHGVGAEFPHHLPSDISAPDKFPGQIFELSARLTQRGFRHHDVGLCHDRFFAR